MGLRAEIQADVAEAFDTDLADAVSVLTLKDNKSSIYDPATGAYNETGLEYLTRGVVSSYTQLEIANSGGAIDITDKKITILTNEVTIVPRTDHLLIINTKEHRIKTIKKDPANVTYKLQVRES